MRSDDHDDHEPDAQRYHDAALAWIEVLASFGATEAVERALSPEIIIERWGFGADAGRVVELIEGREAVARWAALTNPITEFELLGPVRLERPGDAEGGSTVEGVARYVVRVPQFEGGGSFRFALAPDGRITHLAHRPDDLSDALPEARVHDDWRQIVERARRRRGEGTLAVDLDAACDGCQVHEH